MAAFIESSIALATGVRDMYTATNDGTGTTKVNNQSRNFHSVYVLPDGSKAVFAATADGYSQIYYLSPVDSTSTPIQLTMTPGHKTSPVLSADGSKICFSQVSAVQPDPDIWSFDVVVMNADGSHPYLIQPPAGWFFSHPFFSPDGSRIAVAMTTGGFGGDHAVAVMNADGSAFQRLTPGGLDGILAVAPAFSPDGTQIVFSSIASNDLSIYIINADGTGLKRVGQNNGGWSDPLFVADRILFVSSSQIYTMKTDGSDVRQITSNGRPHTFETNFAE